MMTYDLYFHNDFDGWSSAAVMLLFLERRGDRIGHFVPVDFYLQAQWRDDGFFTKHRLFQGKRNAPVVLDFPFHPGMAFWFDHHLSPFKKEAWRKKFHEDAEHAYRPQYFSCCHMAYDMLRRNFKWRPPAYLKQLIAWLDVIDGARYASARQTILMKEPAFDVDNFIDQQAGDPKKAEWLIRQMATAPLKEVAKIPRIAAVGKRARRSAIRNLAFYRKHLTLCGNVTFIDLTRHGNKVLRYAPYYLFPKIRYSVRATMKGRLYHLGVGENPWIANKGKIHIGKLVKKYGGGGHLTVGAADLNTQKEAERAREEIIKILNKSKK
jgi:hypothetical protein